MVKKMFTEFLANIGSISLFGFMFTCKDKCIMVGYSMFLYLGFTIFAMLDIIYVDLICSNSIICSNII